MDQYSVGEWIGGGSFGAVHMITRKSDNQVLVWKAVHYGCMDEAQKKMIVSEVNILRELKSPFVVRYHDRIIDRKSATLYIVMEHCSEGDLGQLLMKTKKEHCFLDESYVWQLAAQLTLGLHFCHHHMGSNGKRERVLHRDLKPANVFLDDDLNAKLGDFGMSKQLSVNEFQSSTMAIGTPVYMSPEVVNGEAYDERSDVWALGCVIYEAAALRPPFTAPNQMALAVKIDAGEYDPLPAHFTEPLKQFVAKLLTLDRSQRPFVADILDLEGFKEFQTLVTSCREKADKVQVGESRGKTRAKTREMTLEMREAEVKKREDALKRKEAELIKREKEIEKREQWLSLQEKKQEKEEEACQVEGKQGESDAVALEEDDTPMKGLVRARVTALNQPTNQQSPLEHLFQVKYKNNVEEVNIHHDNQNIKSTNLENKEVGNHSEDFHKKDDTSKKNLPDKEYEKEMNGRSDKCTDMNTTKQQKEDGQYSAMMSDNFLATLRSPHKRVSESWLRTNKQNEQPGQYTANNVTKFNIDSCLTGGGDGGAFTSEMRTRDLPSSETLTSPSFAARTKMNSSFDPNNVTKYDSKNMTSDINDKAHSVSKIVFKGSEKEDNTVRNQALLSLEKDNDENNEEEERLTFPAVATAEPLQDDSEELNKAEFEATETANKYLEQEIIIEHYGITGSEETASTSTAATRDILNQYNRSNKRHINGSSSVLEKDNILNKYGGGSRQREGGVSVSSSASSGYGDRKRPKRSNCQPIPSETKSDSRQKRAQLSKFNPTPPPPVPPSTTRVNEIVKHLKPHRQLVARRATTTTTTTKEPLNREGRAQYSPSSSTTSSQSCESTSASVHPLPGGGKEPSESLKHKGATDLDLHVSGHAFNGFIHHHPKPPPPSEHLKKKPFPPDMNVVGSDVATVANKENKRDWVVGNGHHTAVGGRPEKRHREI